MPEAKLKKSYYSRFQVKQRRRREGKTDYAKRRKLLRQNTCLYGVYKSRLVVRITCSKVICQVFKPSIAGDILMAQSDSTELKKYGITFGLTNYSAAYATGLLCGMRTLEKVNLIDCGFGTENKAAETVGQYNPQEDLEDTKAFECVLDIGLARATKGARVFAAMKGVSDAGVRVPHSPKRFYGFMNDEDKLDEETLKNKILGEELKEYMISLRENDMEKYKKQFSKMMNTVEPENIPKIYENAFDLIRKDWKKEVKKKDFDYSSFKSFKKPKKTREERKIAIAEKLKAIENINN